MLGRMSIVFLVDVLEDPGSKTGTSGIYKEGICSGYQEGNSLPNTVSTFCPDSPSGKWGGIPDNCTT